MNIAEIITADCANGLGTRLSVFVSGCRMHCKNCFNQVAWDFNYGKFCDEDMRNFIIEELKKPYYKGITILGGEPFEKENQLGVFSLIDTIVLNNTLLHMNKDIWIYTGHKFEELLPGGSSNIGFITSIILNNTDVLVDGKFIEEEKDISLPFRGSRNQRIIDVKKSLEKDRVIELM